MSTLNQYRYLAQVVIELTSPLAIGSGEKLFETDAAVAVDSNNLPYIPGTAIAGVVRSLMDPSQKDVFFGQAGANPIGSSILFTEAKIINSQGCVMDGIVPYSDIANDPILQFYSDLPIRQHVRINHRGVSDEDNYGKFDEQIVYAGTRFCFELEMISNTSDDHRFQQVLDTICHGEFRLGGGTRNGFGNVKVVDLQQRVIDLYNPTERNEYLNKSAMLGSDFWSRDFHSAHQKPSEDWDEYFLELKADDFFYFGSGLGDDEVDMAPVTEYIVVWDGNKANWEECYLLPASSIKGAISHRVCYYWNKQKGYTVGHPFATTGEDNPAVSTLFGFIGKSQEKQERGHVILSDVFIEKTALNSYVNSHLAVDRFTGGALEGALFFEKNVYAHDYPIQLTILVDKKVFNNTDSKSAIIQKALEETLKDICRGLLPLGGGVNRGNGVFSGRLTKNKEVIYE